MIHTNEEMRILKRVSMTENLFEWLVLLQHKLIFIRRKRTLAIYTKNKKEPAETQTKLFVFIQTINSWKKFDESFLCKKYVFANRYIAVTTKLNRFLVLLNLYHVPKPFYAATDLPQ